MTKSAEYGLFNGRRDADQYVKGYLKGIAVISGTALVIILGFSGWVATKINDHDARLVAIEANRFTVSDGMKLKDQITENARNFAVIQEQLRGVSRDIEAMKNIMERYFIKSN